MNDPICCAACGVDSGRVRTPNGSVGSNVPGGWAYAFSELREGGIGVAVWCPPCAEEIERRAAALVEAVGPGACRRGRFSLEWLCALERAR